MSVDAKLELKKLNLATASAEKADLLLVLLPQSSSKKEAKSNEPSKTTPLKSSVSVLSTVIAQAEAAKDLDCGTAGSILHLYSVAQVAARRVIVVGCGQATPQELSKAIASAAGELRQPNIKKAVVLAPQRALADAQIDAIVQSLSALSYLYTTTITKQKPLALEKIIVGVADRQAYLTAFETAQGVAAGIALARELGNRPANLLTPSALAEAAKQLGKEANISTKVYGLKEIEQLKMGSFLAVAKGSSEPPKFIEIRYQGADKALAPIVLIGKGVTFDSGGISIKPAAAMDEMKFDMCGAASVLGAFKMLAELQPAINVVGLIPTTENMPGGKAVKPGDVVTSLSGQTIEILNTDAEGRLILCDAISYADQFKPSAVIDIATLTGACVVALGGVRSGLFSNDDDLSNQLLKAGAEAQDLAWRMPLDEDYSVGLKSNFADMGNVSGREGGSVVAAKFLQKFIGNWPWAHLDVAGTAWKKGGEKGATGRPVGLLSHYLLQQAQKTKDAPTSSKRVKKAAIK